jgi:hypothetical protein
VLTGEDPRVGLGICFATSSCCCVLQYLMTAGVVCSGADW